MYFRFWLRTIGPEIFSVHGAARRTNNNVENFHGRLKEKFQINHPNLWTFLSMYIVYVMVLELLKENFICCSVFIF